MQHGRFISSALVALAAMAIGPAWASAAPAPFVDDTSAQFGAGTPGTATSATDVPGSVRLKRTLKTEPFNGPALPAGYTFTEWGTPPPAGSATIDGTGVLNVDGGHVNADRFFDPGQVLEFRAAFSGAAGQHVGFGDTLGAGPWAIFTTGPGNDLEASTLSTVGTGPGDAKTTPIPFTTAMRTYRIEWSATKVDYYVDGVKVASHDLPSAAPALPQFTTPLRPVISDLTPGDGGKVGVDSLSMSLFPDTGAFESQVFNAGDARAVWGTLASTGSATGITFETRSGKTANPNDGSWSDYQRVTGGAIQSPSGQYIQYRATLTTSDDRVTPSLDSVTINYDIDAAAPSVAADAVQVNGTTARLPFSSPDSDLAGFQCSLDGGAFTPCTSPKEFTGLSAGSHTASVRAVDKVGNVGTPVAKTFSIASSQSGGSAGGGSSQSSNVDNTAPKVTLVAKLLKVTKKGAVSFTVGCPATESTCQITLKLKNGTKTVASKTVTVKGGKTKTVTLQLNKATRSQLKHRSLKLSSVLTATDAAGNKKVTSKKVTLHKS